MTILFQNFSQDTSPILSNSLLLFLFQNFPYFLECTSLNYLSGMIEKLYLLGT